MKLSSLSTFSSGKPKSTQAGFTLIEMVVVAAIIVILSTAIITNFSRTRIDIDQTANLVVSVVREAQSKAISSSVYKGYNPCGYGVHYVSSNQIAIYVGQDASSVDCQSVANKNYQQGRDDILRTETFTDSKVQFISSFNDAFFLPPDPKTYLNNDASLNQSPLTIRVGPLGSICSQNCRTISIYPSGKIESQ